MTFFLCGHLLGCERQCRHGAWGGELQPDGVSRGGKRATPRRVAAVSCRKIALQLVALASRAMEESKLIEDVEKGCTVVATATRAE